MKKELFQKIISRSMELIFPKHYNAGILLKFGDLLELSTKFHSQVAITKPRIVVQFSTVVICLILSLTDIMNAPIQKAALN